MIAAVQLGLLAASIVVVVPITLAGYHLSRNKVLFFGAALFISLAVAVHLSPLFPSLSLSSFYPQSPSFPSLPNPDSCLSLLHHIHFLHRGNDSLSWSWVLSNDAVLGCGFQKLNPGDARDLLNGSWVLVAGDSQARLFTLALLDLVLDDEKQMGLVRNDLFKRHSDYHLVVGEIGLRLDFIWAPYVTNLTDLAMNLRGNRTYPDVILMGSGLWHMLHVNNPLDYRDSLRVLAQSLAPLMKGRLRPHMFWLGMPILVNSMLNTEEKRERMADAMQMEYDRGFRRGEIVQPGGPFVLLDVRALSGSCGARCTEDGMHYDGVVYEAEVHVMLNALLVQSQQKL